GFARGNIWEQTIIVVDLIVLQHRGQLQQCSRKFRRGLQQLDQFLCGFVHVRFWFGCFLVELEDYDVAIW
ncbi:MAG: hypothetical protein SPE35_04525, partial [Butyricicoccus sp.]|nr:hypothetical protein [Butyricicoccus sp.]